MTVYGLSRSIPSKISNLNKQRVASIDSIQHRRMEFLRLEAKGVGYDGRSYSSSFSPRLSSPGTFLAAILILAVGATI